MRNSEHQTASDGNASGHPLPVEPLIRAADGTLSLGRYVLHQTLEEHGDSLLYGGFDPEASRDVSIELQATTTQDQAAVVREARRLVAVQDPHVVAVREAGGYADARDASRVGAFLVTQPIRGLKFNRWLGARSRKTRTGSEVEQVVSIFVQAARWLAAVHDAGLAHGSFAASSIIVGYDGLAKLQGFGREPTPERALDTSRGTPASQWSDQYAFGRVLHDALVQVANKIPRRIDKVLTRGTSLNADERFPSMTAFAEALERGPLLRRFRSISIGAAALAIASLAQLLGG